MVACHEVRMGDDDIFCGSGWQQLFSLTPMPPPLRVKPCILVRSFPVLLKSYEKILHALIIKSLSVTCTCITSTFV